MKKVGILGGGQLGRMMLQAAANYPVETYVLENDATCPSAHLCHHFVKGSITDFETVYQFGKGLDALTIEIEAVNVDALEKLEAEGVRVIPKPAALRTIKNKVHQKEFYANNSIKTAPFIITKDLADTRANASFLPAVHKIAEGGYDGKGVQVLETEADIEKGFDAPSVLEKMVTIDKEIAQMIAVNEKGETALFPTVDMVFDPRLNLLDFQISPAQLPDAVLWKVEALSLAVVKGLKSPGLFAVELFVDKAGEVYVNETAPRVHNSGHHTIEGNYSSQFDMLWRILLEYPLGNPDPILPAAIVNVLGAPGHDGPAYYEGLEEVLAMDQVFVHLYGKKQTKPGRKMGHVTIISAERQDLIYKAHRIKEYLKVITK